MSGTNDFTTMSVRRSTRIRVEKGKLVESESLDSVINRALDALQGKPAATVSA